MPVYDVQCRSCGERSTATLKIEELAAWDKAAQCPTCQAADGKYRRIILLAPLHRMGAAGSSRVETARKEDAKAQFKTSVEKAEMMHKSEVRVDQAQKAACFEGAKKGG